MAHEVIELLCPGCHESLSTSDKECPSCGRTVVIKDYDQVESMSMLDVNKYISSYTRALQAHPDNLDVNISIAICFLKLKMYDKAYASFEKAMPDNFDNADVFFYAAVCLLEGKKAFVTPKAKIDKALQLLESATMIEPKAIYYYMMAYLKYDYYARKFLRVSPSYQDCLAMAKQAGLDSHEMRRFYSITGVDRPSVL